MVLPLWRSLHSLNLMLPKEERRAMLLRLFNDDEPLIDHSKERFERANGENEASNAASDPSVADANVTSTAAAAMDIQAIDDVMEGVQDDIEVLNRAFTEEDGGVNLGNEEDNMEVLEDIELAVEENAQKVT